LVFVEKRDEAEEAELVTEVVRRTTTFVSEDIKQNDSKRYTEPIPYLRGR
jgi:hypothetical protein